ncbi:MAG: amidase, partial [Rhodospirillaceae bacterium]|nr:amidase [Rhodospirillaceae bacterium]
GSAAIVAAGGVPIASGGDAGGSIRMPASFCGLVGLKPTRGRVTAPGDVESLSGLAHNFALTRTVRDCAALLDAVEGPDLGDPYAIAPPVRPYLDEIGHPPDRLSIGFATTAWSGLPVDSDVADAVRSAAGMCAQLGHTVEESAPEIDYEPYLAAQKIIWCAYTAYGVNQIARATERTPSEHNLQATTWATYVAGLDVTAEAFMNAVAHYDGVVRRASAFFDKHDVLLTPTCTITPRTLGTFDPDAPGATVGMIFDQLGPHETFTALFNATGQPAISLPLGQGDTGLPIGIQVVSRFGRDDVLLALAATLEEAMPWKDRVPTVHAGHV